MNVGHSVGCGAVVCVWDVDRERVSWVEAGWFGVASVSDRVCGGVVSLVIVGGVVGYRGCRCGCGLVRAFSLWCGGVLWVFCGKNRIFW